MNEKISRRQLLKLFAVAGWSIALGKVPTRRLPRIRTSARVVHMHSNSATSWNGQTDYWNYVDQAVVNDMVDQGLMALTSTTTVPDAWHALLPNYQAGQGIAIKVNLNNASQCNDADGQIDALIQPVNSVVRGLVQIGVLEADVWVYDAKRAIPYRLVAGSQYDDIRYYGRVPCGHLEATFDSSDPNAYVTFSPPPGIPLPPPIKITDVLIQATYLINMPIMKTHGGTGITLSFKNHLGTVDSPSAFHDYAGLSGPYHRSDYSVLVDLYKNPHIAGKTVLTIGDGLFAAKDNNTAPPSPWQTFGNQVPNSLFFATDPVAIDCVMCDFLAAETTVPAAADDYLLLASTAGLGVYERGSPGGKSYSLIDYQKIELDDPTAAEFTDFSVEFLEPASTVVRWTTVSEIDLLGMYVIQQSGRRVSEFIPAQFPGQILGGTYTWIDRGPSPASTPCYGLDWQDINGYWHVWWPSPPACI